MKFAKMAVVYFNSLALTYISVLLKETCVVEYRINNYRGTGIKIVQYFNLS